MLKDLTRSDWLGFLELVEERIPSVLILRGTRNLRRHYDGYATRFDDVLAVGSPNALFEDLFLGRHGGVNVGYASVYGGPMASEICHVFGVLGTPLVIQVGVCGALGDGIGAGDLIVATEAGCGDGASHCYLPGRERVAATPELVSAVTAMPDLGVPVHAGPIWTTAALLAEGAAEITLWHGEGYLAADMETAAAYAVAEHFGMRRVSVLSVFDNPREGSHVALIEAEKAAARERGEAALLRVLFGLIEGDAAGHGLGDDGGRRPLVHAGAVPPP